MLSLDPQHTAQITSLLDGKVVFVGAQVGDEVRRNQVLVTVHAPALAQAKTAYLQAGAKLELARREFERAEILLKQEAIDQKEHLRRRTEFENASSEFAVAESNLHSYGIDQAAVEQLLRQARRPNNGTAAMDDLAEPYLKLTAPIAGHVVERDVINGQHIEPQKMLLTVSDLSTLWALLDARETDLPHVARGREVRITTSIYPDRVWLGRVDHVGDVVDEKTRTVKVRVVVRNDGRLLKPNMYIQGELPNAVSSRDVLTLPAGGHPDDWRRVGGVRSRRSGQVRGAPGRGRRPRRRPTRGATGPGRIGSGGRRRSVQPQGGTPEIDVGRRVAANMVRGTCTCLNG